VFNLVTIDFTKSYETAYIVNTFDNATNINYNVSLDFVHNYGCYSNGMNTISGGLDIGCVARAICMGVQDHVIHIALILAIMPIVINIILHLVCFFDDKLLDSWNTSKRIIKDEIYSWGFIVVGICGAVISYYVGNFILIRNFYFVVGGLVGFVYVLNLIKKMYYKFKNIN